MDFSLILIMEKKKKAKTVYILHRKLAMLMNDYRESKLKKETKFEINISFCKKLIVILTPNQ